MSEYESKQNASNALYAYAETMTDLTLYGPHWSAYTRSVRLVLIEKAIEYDLVEVDFANGNMPTEHLARHPFAKVPVLTHGGFSLYETHAICRYLEAAFPQNPLQPTNPQDLGRMAQVICIIDAYLSQSIRMEFVTEALINPKLGIATNTERVRAAEQTIVRGFAALVACCEYTGEYLMGEGLTLADTHAAPLFDYLEVGALSLKPNPC